MRLSLSRCLCRSAWSAALALAWLVGAAAAAHAQLPQARLYAIFPCGGKAGSTFDLQLTQSADLDEADRLVFNHPGITAVQKTHDVGGHQQPVDNTFVVTIGSNVPSGVYEVHAHGLFGLSNPRTFVVGSQTEAREVEPNNGFDRANELPPGAIVNGTIGAETDIDVYRFASKKGQRFTAFCRAADVDSRLQPVLELTDESGRRLGYARQELERDPLVDAVLPADGTYYLKVYDFLYRGGAEYGYRLSAGSIPYIDFIMPPAGKAGSTAKYTLYGRNLPGGKPAGMKVDGRPLEKAEVEITLPVSAQPAPTHTTLRSWDAGLGVSSYVLQTPAGESNPVLIALTRSTPVLEHEPNDTPQTAQEISVPGEFAGQFQAPGDTDYFKFHAREGQVFTIEVFADRLGSQADPYLVVEQVELNSKKQEVVTRMTAIDDDNANVAPGVFDTRTDDPSYRFRAPADGTYRVMLRDRSFESRGEPRLTYRLSIQPEEPDFQLVVLPEYPKRGTMQAVSTWALGLRKGDSREVQVLVLRKDGFREPIEVRADGLPKGVTCRGTALAGNAKSGELIFTAAEDAPESSTLIHVSGVARLTDPKKVAALAETDSVLAKANATREKAVWVSVAAASAAKKARELLEINRRLAQNDQKDAILAKAVADAQLAVNSTETARRRVKIWELDAEEKLAKAEQRRAAAAQAAAPRELVHEAIPGTIVWSAEQLSPAVSRVGQSLALSVMKETAPFQLSTEVARLEVNQGRQILLPLKLTRRNGFDGDVTMALAGIAPGNLNLQNKPFPKGQTDELLRLLVARGTRPGAYAIYWNLQAPVPYRRNVYALERAEREQTAAAKAAAEAATQAKTASGLKDHATKRVTELTAALKPLKTRASELERTLAEAQRQSKIADAKAKSPAVNEALALAEATAHVAEVARKSADEAEANARSASESARPELKARAAAARQLAAELQKSADAAATKARPVGAAPTVANKRPSVADLSKLAAESETAHHRLADAETALKSAIATKKQADTEAAAAQARSQQAAAAKTAAEKRLAEAKQAAAPKPTTDFAPSTPILLIVKAAPFEVSATVAKGGKVKRGARVDVKVKVRRTRAFKGPVTLELPLPPGVTGIKAESVTIPADKSEAVLKIAVEKTAKPGPVANLVVRGAAQFEGQAEVDAPITLQVDP